MRRPDTPRPATSSINPTRRGLQALHQARTLRTGALLILLLPFAACEELAAPELGADPSEASAVVSARAGGLDVTFEGPTGPTDAPLYSYVYGDWVGALESQSGGVAAARFRPEAVLSVAEDGSGHFHASSVLSAPLEFHEVIATGPHFTLVGEAHTRRGSLPIEVAGMTVNDQMWAEIVLDGRVYAFTAQRN